MQMAAATRWSVAIYWVRCLSCRTKPTALPLWQSMAWIAVGKGLRYLLVVLGMLGVLQLA